MTTVTVDTKAQLKQAMASHTSCIVVKDPLLCQQLNAVRLLKKAGPWVLASIVAALPLIPATGGASLKVALASTAAKTGVSASALVAIGGAILLSLLTDWKIIKIGEWIRLER